MTRARQRVVEARARLERELGRVPTGREIASELGLTTQAVTYHLRALGLPSSVDVKRERGELALQRSDRAARARAAERERVDLELQRLASLGLTQQQIGERMGLAVATVCNRLRAAGVRRTERWSARQRVQMVRMLADGVPLHRVARTLGRSPCAVHSSLYRLLRGDIAASERVKAELEAGALERARATLRATMLGFRDR
jgi:DNA-binding CsgD family transcriptional regulator